MEILEVVLTGASEGEWANWQGDENVPIDA